MFVAKTLWGVFLNSEQNLIFKLWVLIKFAVI